ncbi:GerAB/ArcD/ProY family transporter [Paenibacillus sp. Marseille-Q4541]|uniref:GerAB/ArcD/ProY family transporter n=1 Tax=Paenibacillus sp. Marseille-Q4541 TaxID=2831522 RepID=UPI001BA8F145|nr:GerAB/ArcD/ProY family transporter [Paenibacillus sp. Marseille-Q4541]
MDRKGFPAAVLYVICQLGLVFFLYPADLIGSMETGHSLGILLGILVHFLMITIYIKGLNLAKRKDVLEIFSNTSRILAWICLLPVFFYTASAFIITIRAYSEMLILVFLPNTPVWAILLLLITISCIIVLQGIQSMARTALLAGVLFILPIVFVLCLSFQNADWRFALPLVDRYQTFFVSDNLYQTSLSVFAGGFLFLGFLPSSMDIRIRKIWYVNLLMLPMYFLSVYLPLLTFGQASAKLYEFPVLMTIDTLNITWLMFDRATIFFLLSIVGLAILFMGICLWMLGVMMKRAIPLIPTSYIIVGLTVVLFCISVAIPNWVYLRNFQTYLAPLRLYVLLGVPLLTLWLGLRLKRKNSRKTNRKTEVI